MTVQNQTPVSVCTVCFHVLSKILYMLLYSVHWISEASRATLLQIIPMHWLCSSCFSGLPNYNNPSQQCRALSDFRVHVLLITTYFKSAVTEAVMLSL